MLHSQLLRYVAALALAAGLVLADTPLCRAAAVEVKLKNGTVLRGVLREVETLPVGLRKTDHSPITIFPILMVYSPLKRYYVPVRQRDVVNPDVDLSREGGFPLQQTKRPGSTGKVIASVQGFTEKPGPFDEWGRRTVRLEMAAGETPVIQGVTRITPEYLQITALNFAWDTAMATSSVPSESLDAMLRHVTDENNPDERLKLARFFIEAKRYELAAGELAAIRVKFPELAETIGLVEVALAQALARQALNELKLRRAAGQHQFVYEKSRSFPVEKIATPLLREAREIAQEYEQAYERKERVVAELGELQAQMKDDPRVREIAAAAGRAGRETQLCQPRSSRCLFQTGRRSAIESPGKTGARPVGVGGGERQCRHGNQSGPALLAGPVPAAGLSAIGDGCRWRGARKSWENWRRWKALGPIGSRRSCLCCRLRLIPAPPRRGRRFEFPSRTPGRAAGRLLGLASARVSPRSSLSADRRLARRTGGAATGVAGILGRHRGTRRSVAAARLHRDRSGIFRKS